MTVDLIAAYQKHLVRLDRSPNTVECYIRVLLQADNELPYGLVGATTEELEDWLFSESPSRRGGGPRGKTTRSHYVRVLQGWGKWTVDPKTPERFRLDFDATADLPEIRALKTKPKPVQEDALADILARAAEPYVGWFELAAYEGLRCCEISRANRQDITEERVWVRGKGDVERYIPTHPLVWRRVKDLPPGPIVVDEAGNRLTPRQVGHRAAYQLRRLGHSGISMHAMRHRFASRTYDATRDLVAVQELLGHSDVSTTRRYVEVNRDRMAAAVASLPVAG